MDFDDEARAVLAAYPRPVWSQRSKEDVRLQKQLLGLPSSSQVRQELKEMHHYSSSQEDDQDSSSFLNDDTDVPVIDIQLAIKALERQQKRRFFVVDLFLGVSLCVVLCVYALNARIIPQQYFVGQGVWNDLVRRPFLVEASSFDLRTTLNTSLPVDAFGVELPNLDPGTLIPPSGDYTRSLNFHSECGGVDATCLPLQLTRTFQSIRSLKDFGRWVEAIATGESQLLQGRTLAVLGRVRIRQLRHPGTPFTCALTPYQSAQDMARFSFHSSHNNNESAFTTQGPDSPITPASRLGWEYAADGYAFDFAPSTSSNSAWTSLLAECPDWLSPAHTKALLVSFTAYDYVSDALVFAQLAVENFSEQGAVLVMEPDVRVFRIPGSPSDQYANAWRIALCILSLAYLCFYLVRLVFRTSQRYRKKYADIWWDRWLGLNLVSLALIQAAVWTSLKNTLDAPTQFVGSNLAVFMQQQNTSSSYVALFDNLSWDEKLADVLLGVALLVEACKLLQLLQNAWPTAASPYLTLNYIASDLLAWLLLVLCIYFFLSVGAVYLFGSWLGGFSSTALAMQNTFLILSKAPGVQQQPASSSSAASVQSPAFWQWLEYPSGSSASSQLVWELNSFFFSYQANGVVSFAMWFSLAVLLVFWMLRNLLLGIVMTGYETVRRELDANALEETKQQMLRRNGRKRRTGAGAVGATPVMRRIERFWWKIWHQVKLDHFLAVIVTRAQCPITTSLHMRAIFEETLLPQWYRDEFLERFLYPLRLVDQAIILLVNEERAFALSLCALSRIRQEAAQAAGMKKEDVVGLVVDACRQQYEFQPHLPFWRDVGRAAWADSTPAIQQYCVDLADQCPDDGSGSGTCGGVDVARLAFRLLARVSRSSGTSRRTAEEVLVACADELQLDFTGVVWDELVAWVDGALNGEGGEAEQHVVWRLADSFPSRNTFNGGRKPPTMADLKGGEEQLAEVLDEEYAFNPHAQQKWDTCLMSGEFALTLSVMTAVRAQHVCAFLHHELFALEQAHKDVEKEILRTQQMLDGTYDWNHRHHHKTKTSKKKKKKHGIEFHPHDVTYHVHFYAAQSDTYKWVGVFNTQEDAEVALQRTIDDFEAVPFATAAAARRLSLDQDDLDDDWQSDNAHYSEDDDDEEPNTVRLPVNLMQEGDLFSNRAAAREEDEDEDGMYDAAGVSSKTMKKKKATWRERAHAASLDCWSAMRVVCGGVAHKLLSLVGGGRAANRLHYDINDTVWRDFQGRTVTEDVITKPKSILPVAGNTYLELSGGGGGK